MTRGRWLLLSAGGLVALLIAAFVVLLPFATFDAGGEGPTPASDRNRALAAAHLERLFGGGLAGVSLDGMHQLKTVYTSDLFLFDELDGQPPEGLPLFDASADSAAKLSWCVEAFPELIQNVDVAYRYASDFIADSGVEAMVFAFEDGRTYLFVTDF